MTAIDRCFNIEDLRQEARRRLPRWLFDFVDRGSEDEWALNHNRESFRRLKLRNRAFVDISGRQLGTTLLGQEVKLPLAIAPMGATGLCWYEGELELARAAHALGVPFVMATASTTSLEKVAEVGGNLWFQLYLWERRELSHALIRRAHDAGYSVLVVTGDSGAGTNREYNYRNRFANPPRPAYPIVRDILLRPGWFIRVLGRYLATSGMPRMANNPPEMRHLPTIATRSETITWDDFARLRDIWPGKVLVKGIVRADDAALAVQNGADGVIVSNHGGRNMDSAVAPIDALPAIVREVGDRSTVILDSGIRRGSDMAKGYALGADAVLIGRPGLWGAACGGQAGAVRAIEILRNELDKTLAYVGCRSIDELRPDVLASCLPLHGHGLE